MATATTEPYRTYSPRPFTRSERDSTTVLFGGLHWRLERLIEAVLKNCGYQARILPVATKEDLLTGREVADIGQCCPTSFTTGNLVNFLKKETKAIGADQVNKRYVYLTAGSCGACRFGQYHQSYELALRNTGLEAFRMFLLAQDQLDQKDVMGDGLDFNLPITFGCLWAIFCADLVQDLEYQVRPYEVEAGRTDAIVRESMDYLFEVFEKRPRKESWRAVSWHLTTPYFTRALREVHRRFATIEVDRFRVKPKVKITGEFYLQTVEGDPNYNIHRWLEAEGAEVYPAAVTVWMDYLLRLGLQRFEDYTGIERGARLKLGAGRTVQAIYRLTFDRLRRAMGSLPHEIPNQLELRRLAAPYFHSRLDGGEGDMLVGKSLWAHTKKKAHMICELSPYSCMPNTMSIGAMAGVVGKYPDLLYAPLEIKGDAEVHALSRCQMILTEAKKRAHREFEGVLEATGLTLDEVRACVAARPAMRLATYPIPHKGLAAGTAANLVLHVAELMGRRARSADLSSDPSSNGSRAKATAAVAS
jgi:predicted nucleotide-binding protein (sugar kinase/HSP70/actin superfamily)